MVGLKLLSHKMKGEKGNHPYVVGVLFGFFLAVFPGSSACPKLCACYVPTEVHCTFRYLTTVPLHISQNVERINLGYNNLVKLTETDFSGLEKLELLMLHSNQIHTIQDKTFSDLHSLKILKMSYNQIKLIQADTFYGLVALVRLQMDHNKIEFVNPKALYGLTSLKLVHLEGNLLKQLHPDTFVTLRYLEVFRTSVIKHIYLSDNFLTSLPQDIFSYMSELESLYLHGNPWTCDCALKWFAKWAERHSDVVKCKKGREATDALQCPLCTNPRNSKEKLLTKIPLSSFNCSKPTVDTDLKLKTITVVDDGELTSVSPKDFMAPIGSMSLNLIDQTGNQANIDCNVQKPSKISPVIFKKTDNNTLLEISLSTFLKCSIDHDHIHQLWSILALYSDSPLKLRQEHLLTEMPSIKYKYKQIDSKNEELFTNIEAELTAEPHWLMQSQVSMQLDRTATTLNMLHIQYSIDAQIILPDDVPKPTKQMWAMILQDENSKTEHSVLVNGSVKLDCQAIGAPTPVTEWLLPDGTKVKAPYVSEDGRIVIEKSGKLLLHSADYFDTGLYHCIGTNYEDADVLTFRITVIDPNLKHNLLNGAQLSVFLGEIIDLPCPSTGVPDASINWVIPGNMILHSSFKNKHLFHNGTLKIQPTTGQDNGYFMCIIANKYGVDYLVYQVLVKRNLSKLQQLTKKDTQVDSEATEGSGNQEHDYTGQIQNFPSTIPAEVTTQASMQSSFTNYFIHNKNKNKYKEIYRTNRGKISRRFRGQKRFGLSTKRINSLHWATFLEKTRNITLLRRQENITVKPTENAFLSSKSSENEGEISGDDILAEEELMFLATRRPSKYTLREASGNVVTAKFGSMSDNYSSFATYNIVTEPEPLATSSMVMQSEIPIDQNWLNKPKPEMDGIGLERYQTLPTPPTLMEATMPSLFKEPNSATNTSNSFQRLITSEEGNVYFKSKTTVIPTVAITNNSQFIISHSIVEKPDLLAENAEKASKKSSHQVPTAAVSLSNNASQHGYIYSRKKIILQVSPGPAILGHQQIEVVKDSATHSPFPRWYSRRRKTFGRRRIIRPDRISNNAGHRFTFPRAGFVPESSSLTFPTEISIQTPSNISVESFTPQTFMYTSIKPPYPKSTISSHTVISSSNKINTDEVYEASTTIPFYSKSTQVVLQRKIKSGTHQAIPDIDPSANIPFTTNIHKSKLNLKSTFTKANISPFMIKSTIPSFIIHDVSSSVSNGEIPSHNSFVTSYIQKELLQKQSIIQAKPSSEIYVTDFHISGPTYKNSSIYETNVSKSDNQTDVPRDSVERIGENVSLLKDNPILSLSTTESPSLVPMYTFTTDLNKETDTTNNQLIHNPTTTVANKFSKLKIFRRQRKKGQRRRRPLQKSMSFHRNILVNKGFVTPFKNIIPSPIMKTMKNVTEPPSLILTELFSKFTTMDIVTVIPQPPILSTADIKRDNTFLATGQESLENAYNIKLPMELSSEKLSSTAPQFEMSLDTTKISTVLPDTSLVTTGPMFTKVLQTTRQADKESYQYVGLTATSKIQITKTALHVKKEINPQIPTNAIYMTTSPLVSQTRLIQTTQTTSSPRWGKISWQFPLSKIRDTGKPLITNTVLKSTQSSTLYTPLWKIDKKNYIKNWSERIDQVATTTNPEDLNSFYQTRLAKPRISGGKFAVFTVLANSDAFIPCEANGNPQPAIHWTKISAGSDASKNRHHNRFEILPNGTLSIQNVSIQDRGQYLCVAANQQGSDKLLVTLSVVTYPPRILGKSSRIITVHSGKPAFMRCAAEGHPIPSITWILANKTHISEFSVENEAVSLHSDGTLLIKKVSVYDRGIYTCTANNPIGSDTMAIRLQVIAAPPIILEDKKQLILETMGESLKFPCTVKGDPHPTVHWVLPDGTEMKPLHYLNGKVFLFPNGSLLIRSIVPSDSGKYECIATSSTGSERRVVLLQVERQDIIPRIGATSQRFTQLNFGNRLLLNCSATGEPKPRIMWRLPSKAVVDQWHRMGSRIHVYPNGSLVIESITEKDAGDYICVARNRMGDDLTLLKVSVTMKPAKIDHKEYFKKLVPYGKDFKVDCKASGSPEPEISWSLPDGTTINNAMQADDSGHMLKKYTVFDNGTLYFNKVGMMEEGDYTCHAQNTLGKDEMKVQIKVIAAVPRIRQNSKAYAKIKAGDNAFFDCDAIGEPKPKIFWLLPSNNMILASAQRYILHINGSLSIIKVRLLDAGEYICVARNSGGDETKVYKLDVISKPPLINGLYSNKSVIKATAIKHSKKQIACNAEGDPVPQIMWIMPDNIFLTSPYYGSRITVHRNGTLEIRNVRSSDTAEFICIARNDGGESMLVVHLEVLEILRRPIFRNPFNEKVIAKPGKTIFLNCSVDGNPRPEIIWILPNGTQLYTGIRTLRFYLGSNGTLVINRLSKADAGKYRCSAKNKVGYIEKLIILETGETPMIFIHSGGTIKSISGESLSLHCLAAGSPKPNIIWTLPSGFVLDRPQINGKYTLLENGTLLIRETNIHDRGNYMCKAQNYIGDSTVVVFVTIVGHSPRITKRPPRNIHTVAGLAIQLHCMAFGIPDPEITWELPNHSLFFTGIKGKLSGSEILHPQGMLIIHNPNSSDSGIYKCVAKNQFGKDFTVTYVQIISNRNKV